MRNRQETATCVRYHIIVSYAVPKRDRVLEAVFAEPTRKNIPWREIESLFVRHGAQLTEGRGSRVRVTFDVGVGVVRATFHRPHPQNEAHMALVRAVRRFLTEAGVTP
jgi:hypothetical protein